MSTSVRKTCINFVIKTIKWFPVLVSASLFSWGWYAYVVEVIILSMNNIFQQIACFIIFHFLYILSIWSYIQTIFAPSGKIPHKFFMTKEVITNVQSALSERERDETLFQMVKKNELPISCRTRFGSIRYCEVCNLIKPDRCHHCSVCGTCVLRMDHHCPWINNCVSFTNHKFFVLFLGYTFTLCLFTFATTFPYFFRFWNTPIPGTIPEDPFNQERIPFSGRFHILFLSFVSLMLMIGVVFLYCYHLHLIVKNRSTLESFRPPLMTYGPDKNAFNLGKTENINQIFGRKKILWFFPIFTTEGSGLFYDQRRQLHAGDEEVRQGLMSTQSAI